MSYSGYLRYLLLGSFLVALLTTSAMLWFGPPAPAWRQHFALRSTAVAKRTNLSVRQRQAYGGVSAPENRQALSATVSQPASTALLGAKVISEEIFYQVRGLSAEAVAKQINARGPTDGARHYAANTRWLFSWSYRYRSEGEHCKIASASVDVKLIYTYPDWVDAPNAEPELAVRWESFMAALVVHEQRHGTLAAEAGAELIQALHQLAPAPSCSELGRRAESLSSTVIAHHNQRQIDYDAETHHGESQGASW